MGQRDSARRRRSTVQAAVDSLAGIAKRTVKRWAVVRIRSGPAERLKIGLHLASNNYRDGSVERPVQDAIAAAMFPGAVFFDIGANVGFFTLVAAGSVDGAATLVAFEPRADVAAALERNVRRNGLDVDVLQVAVGDAEGTVDLLLAEHPGGATIAADKAVDTSGVAQVRQVTIDGLVLAGRLPRPDVVKIDVEGAEPAVIRGMATTLREARPVVVYEIDAAAVSQAEDQYAEVARLLDDAGYRSERLAPSYETTGWSVVHAVARPTTASSPGSPTASA